MIGTDNGGDVPAARALGDRIAVIGTAAAGKTSFSHRLAAAIRAPCISLDGLAGANPFRRRTAPEFRARAAAAVRRPRWVIDGFYERTSPEIVWPRAESIVWLDHGLVRKSWWLGGRVMRSARRRWRDDRLTRGILRDLVTLCVGNVSMQMLLKSHVTHRRRLPALLESQRQAGLCVVRLTDLQQVREFLAQIEGMAEPPDSPS